MEPSTIYQELVKATPVVIGGLLAVLGGVLGQVTTHLLAKRREKNAKLRERIETLVKALYAHSQWLDDKRNVMIFRNEDHNSPSPLDEARMIQKLYFPELAAEMLAISQAQIPMLEFIGQQRVERMRDQTAWVKAWNATPYSEFYKIHLSALEAATKKCREILQTQLKS